MAKKVISYDYPACSISIRDDFDSGNLGTVTFQEGPQIRVSPAFDCAGTSFQSYSRSWFHFKVVCSAEVRASFIVEGVNVLNKWLLDKNQHHRIVYSQDGGPWQRVSEKDCSIRKDSKMLLTFNHWLHEKEIAFALTYPFSYLDNIRLLDQIQDYAIGKPFKFIKQLLIRSPKGRSIHLLTVTNNDSSPELDDLLHEQPLFTEAPQAPTYQKPVIMITARVHPGQVPSSFAMKGMLQFLVSDDLRACLLRSFFQFKIVPMLNPDGVAMGHFRMDTYGRNLNRYYNSCTAVEQPSIFAVKRLCEFYCKHGLLAFYFDLHGHGSRKGNFIYGNALNSLIEQAEAFTFCRLLALNCSNFEYENCNFSERHMKIKDRNEQLSKQGCGRVVIHRLANIVHSYTLECSLFAAASTRPAPPPSNQYFEVSGKGLLHEQPKIEDQYRLQTPAQYEQLGMAVLVSVLDVFQRNPYSRVPSSEYINTAQLRIATAQQVFMNNERFRRVQLFCHQKIKDFPRSIKAFYIKKYQEMPCFDLRHSQLFQSVIWPENVPGLFQPAKQQIRKKINYPVIKRNAVTKKKIDLAVIQKNQQQTKQQLAPVMSSPIIEIIKMNQGLTSESGLSMIESFLKLSSISGLNGLRLNQMQLCKSSRSKPKPSSTKNLSTERLDAGCRENERVKNLLRQTLRINSLQGKFKKFNTKQGTVVSRFTMNDQIGQFMRQRMSRWPCQLPNDKQ